MIGETPQPGEKPSHEANPWSFSDPESGWWRGETDRGATEPPTGGSRHPRRRSPAQQPQAAPGGTGTLLPPGEVPVRTRRAGDAATGHAAGAHDTARELDPATRARTEQILERDHDRPDEHRYDPLRPPAGYTPRRAAATVAADEPAAVRADPAESPTVRATPEPEAATVAPDLPTEAEPEPREEPDVMVLPEPNDRNRPTVPLERGPVAGLTRQNRRERPAGPLIRPAEPFTRPTEPLPRPTGDPETDARLERLENSPFWHTNHETITEPPVADRPARPGLRPGSRHGRAHRAPIASLTALIALGLLAAFFAWVSAEPFWLAMGHGDRGYATVTSCTSSGVTQHCVGRFTATDESFTMRQVTLLGIGPGHRVPGTVSPARMISPDSPRAYVGDTSPLLQMRWLLGFTLLMFCGYAIAGVTGARRLETGRARRGAVLASLAGPVLLLLGFLIAAF